MKLVSKFLLSAVITILGVASMSSDTNAAELKGLVVEHAKVRAAIPGTSNTAGYAIIKNITNKDIKLVGAKSDIAAKVEYHQHLHQGGLMKMIKLDDVTIPANDSLVFESGGLHIMFLEVDSKMSDQKSATVKLIDENGRSVDVEFSVQSIHEKRHHH